MRSALQKHLQGQLSTTGAAYSRFLYALPVIAIYLTVLAVIYDQSLPQINAKFLLFCALGGVCQIMFTVFLLWMFSFQSFAVGTTFSKLEVVMIAVLGSLVLADELNGIAILAIALSTLGVFALSIGQNKVSFSSIWTGLATKSTYIGLVSAAWLGGSVVFFRGASLSLHYDNFILGAAFTLFISLIIQTVLMGGYLLWKESAQIPLVIKNWRWAGAAGITGALGSICWFTAFTIQNASYVRAVGQIELVFTFIATTVFFREKVSVSEFFGISLVIGAILLLLLFG